MEKRCLGDLMIGENLERYEPFFNYLVNKNN